MEEERLKAALREICTEEWNASARPIFLSHVPRILADRFQIEYKLILKGKSLKAFVTETSPDAGYRLIQHPVQRAKVCIVPSQADFSFALDSENLAQESFSKQDFQGVIKALKLLTPDELSELKIPARIIVRLFEKF